MFKLSPSSLNLFQECPRCFYLTMHKIWKRPAGIFPSLPSGMDKILKTHFNNFRDKKLLPPELAENKECRGMKLFAEKEKLKDWQSNFKGIQFTDKKGNILRGAVDNILVKGKKLIVLDYKTRGFPLKEDTADHYQLQLDIYNFLLKKNGYETEDYAFLLFYVPKEVLSGGEIIFDTELVRMKVDGKRGERVWKRALGVLEGDAPKEHGKGRGGGGEGCGWCVNIEI